MTKPSLFKRLLAAIYDGFLVLAVLFVATAMTLPFTKGESANNIYMSFYLLTVIYIFFAWFWTHGGQTLGMRSWKLKLESFDGRTVNWQQSFIRFITGLPSWSLFFFGILLWMLPDKIVLTDALNNIPHGLISLAGFIWILTDNLHNHWRDKLSKTKIVLAE